VSPVKYFEFFVFVCLKKESDDNLMQSDPVLESEVAALVNYGLPDGRGTHHVDPFADCIPERRPVNNYDALSLIRTVVRGRTSIAALCLYQKLRYYCILICLA
jgi:hypothetical protein